MAEAAAVFPARQTPEREVPKTARRMVTTTSPRSRSHPHQVLQVPGPRVLRTVCNGSSA